MLNAITPRNALYIVLAAAAATIAGAWVFQFAGYDPCHLCLMERWAYYATIALSVILLTTRSNHSTGFFVLAVIMLASAVLGTYHAGVEWKWWAGPDTCTGTGALAGLPDLTKPVVMCDEAAIRIIGLSLAGWNALISTGMVAIALLGARR